MSMLLPVMIRTFGRTGSTLLMQILGTSDRMCFERRYPFEQRYLTYTHHLARMISLHRRSPICNGTTILCLPAKAIALALCHIPRLKRSIEKSFRRIVSVLCGKSFQSAMRETHELKQGEKAFYAEKVPNQVALAANDHLEARNIFLLRDPRDEMVSIKFFNEKRGINSFGWQDNDCDLTFATRMCKTHHKFLKNLVGFKSNRRRTFVRYEDLIRNGEVRSCPIVRMARDRDVDGKGTKR